MSKYLEEERFKKNNTYQEIIVKKEVLDKQALKDMKNQIQEKQEKFERQIEQSQKEFQHELTLKMEQRRLKEMDVIDNLQKRKMREFKIKDKILRKHENDSQSLEKIKNFMSTTINFKR